MKQLEDAINILGSIGYATIATVTPDGEPWNSPVRYVYDDDLNMYWFSDKRSQHSRNISSSSDVYIVIYDSTVPEGQGQGIYMQASAVEISDPDEILKARRLKKGEAYQAVPGEFLGSEIRRVYKAVPSKIWLNSAEINDGVFVRDYRIEIQVNDLRGYTRG